MNAGWFKYLPSFLRHRLHERHGLQAALGNASWLFVDRSLRLGVGLIVGVWVARYLGPEKFGLLNFSSAFAALFGTFSTLGLDGIIIRELAKQPALRDKLLGSAFALKFAGACFAVVAATLCMSVMRPGQPQTIALVALSAFAFVFQSIFVIDFYFQSKVQSKFTVCATGGAFLVMTLVKVGLLVTSAPFMCFAWAVLGEVALSALFLVLAYRVDHNALSDWQYDRRTMRELVGASWPLIFEGFSLIVHARIDQVMIGEMVGNGEVGQYSAAMRLVEAAAFIPAVIVSTVAPHVTKAKAHGESNYRERLLDVYRAMMITFLIVSTPIFLFGRQIMSFVYGTQFQRAGILLSLLSARLFFTNFGVARTLYITNENLFRYSLVSAIVGVSANIAGNYLLIPSFQAEGAIVASMISFCITTFVMDAFYMETRVNLKLMLRAVLRPFGSRRGEIL